MMIIYFFQIGEELTNIDCGMVHQAGKLDIFVTTYSGTMYVIPWEDNAGVIL